VRLSDLVTAERVDVVNDAVVLDKDACLQRLSELLAKGTTLTQDAIYHVLKERESLQSTGIGDGVAVPHGTIEGASGQIGAVLLCPQGAEFSSVDGKPSKIFFGVVGPRRAVEHLKVLARISRLLRNGQFREQLLNKSDPQDAFDLLMTEDTALG
jgi:nitrogen PTS system EIIA component